MGLNLRLGCALAVSTVIATSPASAWDNPAERYLDAYKQYAGATCPVPADGIQHFVYFARDREAIRDHAFLKSERFAGAQIMYDWGHLEPTEDVYDFAALEDDLTYLAEHGKKLFVQLQDATFMPNNKAVPAYLLADAYDGGAVPQYDDDRKIEGWVAKRWNTEVQRRFDALLTALGRQFDGRVEGINLQESAIGVSHETDPSFTAAGYVDALKANMSALKAAFPQSTTMQYANFMPGEWLPWEDEGYLREIYRYGEEIGVGLGAPDLMVTRKGQLNHPLAMMHEQTYSVPLGIAVQDGNYVGDTNSDAVVAKRENIVPMLEAFAHDFLKVDYMFWVDQQPYFTEDVLRCFEPN